MNDFDEAERAKIKNMLSPVLEEYQQKSKEVASDPAFSKLSEKTQVYAKQMDHQIAKAATIFENERRRIMDDPKKSAAEKAKLIKKIHDYIMNKLYTTEEISGFKQRTVMLLL